MLNREAEEKGSFLLPTQPPTQPLHPTLMSALLSTAKRKISLRMS